MASREHSGVRASLPPVDADEADAGGETGLAFTRRALLAAAVAVPVAAAVGVKHVAAEAPSLTDVAPTLPFPVEGEGSWAELLGRFRRIDLAKDRFQEASSAKAYGPGRRPFHEQEALDERFGEVVDAADDAMLALLEAPAPDLEALAVKISLIGDHLVWELEGGEACLVWLEADARRLAGQGK
jgi:hypothetical protein